MKKRSLCFRKSVISAMLAVTLLAGALTLGACNESDPLPEGVSSLPDVDTESFVNSETGEIEWPADLLPEGFPKAKYEEIYSVERVDNEVIIILFAKKDNYHMIVPEYDFSCSLLDAGFVHFYEVENDLSYAINRDGIMVTTTESDDYETHLTAINEKSPTGYTYEIRVKHTDKRAPESMYWEYPDMYTDLGLEVMTFHEWPYEYLPEKFPCAYDFEGVTVSELYQNQNGVFITLDGLWQDLSKFNYALFTSGFYMRSVQPHVSEDGDYLYEIPTYGMDPNTGKAQLKYQVCKFNEHVNTDK